MTTTNTVALAAIAGFTIFLGLPLGRLRTPAIGVRAFLNAVALGILVFLFWDVLSHANEPIEAALTQATGNAAGWGDFSILAALMMSGIILGLGSLVWYERWTANQINVTQRVGPEESADGQVAVRRRRLIPAGAASRLALLIAVGIGLHNFSEGLAIGQSAANGELSLAILLIVGFGLHNATEGFGITAPLVGGRERPSWRYLGLLGVIGGGPTFVGALIGQSYVNDRVYLFFLALAVGSILYVIVQLMAVAQRLNRAVLLYSGLLAGLFAGIATDYIVVAAGA